MIDDTLIFLKDHLNTFLRLAEKQSEQIHERVVFLEGANMEPLKFKEGAVTVLLVNIEEENSLGPPDRYRRVAPDGTGHTVQPEIRLNLYVLFVAHFKEYTDSLKALSRIIRHFQAYPLLTHQNAPTLPAGIQQLISEMITLPFAEQNEVWSALRATYRPSVLYKIKMVVFRDDGAAPAPPIKTADLELRNSS